MHKLPTIIPNTQKVHRIVGGVVLSLGLLGTAGCGSMTGAGTEAQVRFVDTSADAPALDVYLNGVGAAYNLSYATFSSYVPVSAGSYQLSANRASTTQMLTSERAALSSGHEYTAVVSNRLGELQEHLYSDAVPVAVTGTVAVRVLNEVQGGPLDIYMVTGAGLMSSSAPLLTNVVYGINGAYLRVPANAIYTVYAAPAGSSPLAAGVTKVSGSHVGGGSGAARTLILAESSGKDGKGLYGIVLEDAETP